MTQGQLETKLLKNNIDYVLCQELKGHVDSYTEFNKGTLFIINSVKNLELELELFDFGAKGAFWLPEELYLIDELITTLNMGGLWFDRLTMSKKIKNNSNDSTYLNFSNPVLTTSLTKREFEIAELVVIGLSNREIAQKKCISETTVKSHLKNILAKADVKNRTALVNKLRFQ